MKVWRYQVLFIDYKKDRETPVADIIIPDEFIPILRNDYKKHNVSIEDVLVEYFILKAKNKVYHFNNIEVTLDSIYSVPSLNRDFTQNDRSAYIFHTYKGDDA